MKFARPAFAIPAIATASALLLAGCATDGGSATEDSSIKIMVLGSFSEPPYVLPEIPVGAQAAVNRVNAEGGINGRELELIICDDNGNPNDAAACARQAVNDGVAAVVGTFTLFGDSVIPLLEAAGIPDILPVAISNTELSSEISFPVMDGSTVTSAVGGLLARDENCTNVATFGTDFPQSHTNFDTFWEPAIVGYGADAATGVFVPATATDMAPFVAQATTDGADCLAFVTGVQQTAAGIVAAKASGQDGAISVTATALPETVLSQLGTDADGVLALSTYFFPSTGKPVAVQAQQDMAEVDASQPVNDTSLNAYAAVLVFAEVASGLDEITGATVIEALNTVGTIDVGLFNANDFSKTGYLPDAPRLSMSVHQVYVAENGVYVPSDADPIDLRDVLR
jgi:ABC-type branched-chain amino acid transport systems, periplasmic component